MFHGGSSYRKFSKKYFQNSKNAENRSQKNPNVFWTCFGATFSKIFCPVFHGWSSFQKFSKKNQKNFQNSKNAQNRSQKYSNVFWTSFGAQFSMEGFSKKSKKKFKIPKRPKIVPKSIQKCLQHVLGQIFRKFFAQFSMEGRVFENFLPKIFKVFEKKVSKRVLNVFWGNFKWSSSKIPKMPKIVHKEIQTCFERVLGRFFSENFLPKMVEFSNKKIKKISKFQKCPKSFPKVFKRVLNKFWGKFFEKFLPSFPWSVESNQKIFKNSNQKRTKPFPKESKSVWNMFWGKFFENFSPSFPWKVESSKIFKKIKKSLKFQKGPKSFPKVSKSFGKCFGANFSKNFCPVFHGGSSLRKFSKKYQKFSKFQKSRKSLPKVSKRVLNVFWGNFFEKLLPSVPWRVEFSKIFKKNIFKIPKMPKIVHKKIQTCFERVLGRFFSENFLPSVPWMVEFSKIFKKIKKNFKIPKMPKIVPKSIQKCLEHVLGQIFRKIFAQFSMEGRVFENFQKNTKNFQSSKKAENRYQKYPNEFWTCFGAIFSKNFCPVFHGWSSFRKFSKKIFSKFQKCPKSFTKKSKRVLNVFWGDFFPKIFCPVFHGCSSFQKFSKKSKKFQNSKNAQNRSQKFSNVFWTSFGANFSKNFCPVFHGVSSLRNFSKKLKKFSKFQPKTHKTVPKRIQKCLEHVLGQIFRKLFAQFSMEGRVFENFQKNQKKSLKFQKGPKSFPKVSKNVCNMFWGKFFENFLPSFPWRVESSKIFKKIPKIFKVPKKPKIVTKSIQTSSERVLGQFFRKTFAQCSMDGRVFENFQKKYFQNSKNAQNRSQRNPNVFWTCFGAIFFRKFFAQCSMDGRVFKNFQKNQKNFKIPKMPKIVPKSFQTCFEQVLGQIFRKIFAQFSMECRVFETFQKNSKNFQNSNQKRTKPFPKESKSVWNMFWGKFFENFSPSFPWKVESSKIFKKIKKSLKFQKGPKSFPKVSKSVWNMFWGKFFEKFLPSFPWRVESSKIFKKIPKIFKVPKKPKIVTKSIQTSSERVLGQFFRKTFAQCSMEGRVFENFQKKIFSKFQKCPKSFTKKSKRVLNVFWGDFFPKIFCPVFHGWSSFQKFSKKSKTFQNSKNAQNRSQKYSNVFWTSFGANFSKNFCPVFHGVSSLRNFSKKLKKFSKFQPKTHKTVPKRIQKCLEHVFGQIFRKIFAQFSMEGRVLENFQKNQKKFKIPKRPKIVPKSIQKCLEHVLGQIFRKIFAQFSMEGRVFENFQKNQKKFKIPKRPKIVPKSIQKCLEHVLGQIFRKIFAQFSMEGRVFENFQKNQKKFNIPKRPKIVPKSIQKCLEHVLGQIFRKIFAQFSMECRVFETFQKNSKKFSKFQQKRTKPFPKESKSVLNKFCWKFFEKFLPSFPWKVESSKNFKKIRKSLKFQKCPKSFPKVSKRVLNVFWGIFFEKLLPSVPWRVEFSKIFKKIFSKFQKCRKSFTKKSKRVLNVFWGDFFENFLPSVPWMVEFSKIFKKIKKNFKIPKMPKIVSKSIQTCFEQVLGQIFRKIFAQFSMECRVFETFQKNSKNFQISNQKRTKPFPKESKSVWNMFWGKFFEKFLPRFPWSVESSKLFRKTQKNFQNSNQKRTKPFPKESKSVLNKFCCKFFEKILPSFPWKVESSKIFKKIKKKFKIPKRPKIFPKSIQKCLEHVLGQIFRKIFAQFSMEGRVFENFQKNTKNFQSSKKAENRYQKYPNEFWTCFGAIFFEKLLPSVPWMVEFSKIFKKNIFKIPKMPKIVHKKIQTCFERVLGRFFSENFLPSVPWMVEFSKIFKKIKKISNFQKCPKSFPKVFKRVLNKFWGKFFEKFLPSFPWSVESSKLFKKTQKIFKIPTKNAQNRSQKNPKVFGTCFGANFSKKFRPVFHGRSSLRNFSKKSKKV